MPKRDPGAPAPTLAPLPAVLVAAPGAAADTPPAPADLGRARALIDANTWQFARSMPHCPHYYTLRRRWARDEDFVWLVALIRAHGFRERYGRSWYVAWADRGWKYWTMGCPVYADPGFDSRRNTILINRKRVPEVAPNTTPGLVQGVLFLAPLLAPLSVFL